MKFWRLSLVLITAGALALPASAGILFGIWKTRGFREQLSFELPPEE